jgi:hypothetical protein
MSLTTASTKIEVAAATMAELVEFYNATTGKSIKKFETRTKGAERCVALLKDEPNPLAKAAEVLAAGKVTLTEPKSPARRLKLNLSATGPVLKSEPAAKKGAKAAPKPATSGGVKGRAHFSVDGVITIVHKGENPKRAAASTAPA